MKHKKRSDECTICGSKLKIRHYDIEVRTECCSADLEFITVLAAEDVAYACCEACSNTLKANFERGLSPIYQTLERYATCSLCRAPVDRLELNVALNWMHVQEERKPWLTSLEVLDCAEIAVFCADCQSPSGNEQVEAEEENPASANITIEAAELVAANR